MKHFLTPQTDQQTKLSTAIHLKPDFPLVLDSFWIPHRPALHTTPVPGQCIGTLYVTFLGLVQRTCILRSWSHREQGLVTGQGQG